MPDLDGEELYQTDSSDNEEGHSRLINSVAQLDSRQRVKPAQRKEIASEISEFNLGQSLSNRRNLVNVRELTEVLGTKAKHGVISKKIERITKKSKTLPKPLEKVTEERLRRSVGFDKVKKQLRRWDAIVERNALKDQISFPLNNSSMRMQKSNEFLSQFRSKTPLEEEIAKVLKQEDIKETEKEEDEFPLTMEEMIEKRKELAQLRAKLSYKQAKASRQSKIKSKKYHRLLKREKIRQQIREFEILQKTDPEAALKKLAELDKTRAKERASLRHRNTGQWAKNLSVRAKYDVETRKVLAEQLKMSRELTQKVSQLESSDDEEEAGDTVPLENGVQHQTKPVTTFGDNPWTLDVSKEVDEFVSGYKKFWSEQQKQVNQNKTNEEEVKDRNGMDEKVLNEEGNDGDSQVLTEESDGGEVLKGESNGRDREVLGKDGNGGDKKVLNEEGNGRDKKVLGKAGNGGDKKVLKQKSNGTDKKVLGKAGNSEDKKVQDKESNVETRRESPTKKGSKVHKEVEKADKPEPKKSPKIKNPKKVSPKRKEIFVSMQPTSGVWVVEEETDSAVKKKRKKDNMEDLFDEVNDELMATKRRRKEKDSEVKKKKKNNIEDLFDELDDKLMKKATKEVEKLKTKLRKSERKNEETKKKKKKKKKKKEGSKFDTSLKNPNIVERPDTDTGLLEAGVEDVLEEDSPAAILPAKKAPAEIDPQNFIQVKPKRLKSQLPDNITGDEEALDDYKDQEMAIEEAFVDDDVMAEFQERKAEEERQNQLEIETELPGWGTWGGSGIEPSPKHKRLLGLNPPARKDQRKPDVIINENENPNLRAHLVKEVPHPFKSVEAFEANIRTPVGRDWVPETAHHKFIQKHVVTKLGAVIEPMSEEEIIKMKKAAKSPYRGKKGKNT